MGRVSLDLRTIADELGTDLRKVRNFLAWWRRKHPKEAFKADGVAITKTAPAYTYKRSTADRIKKAYLRQRVQKAWKKGEAK